MYDFQIDDNDGLIKIQLLQGHHPLEATISILVSLATAKEEERRRRPSSLKQKQTWRSSASSAVDLWLLAGQEGIFGG